MNAELETPAFQTHNSLENCVVQYACRDVGILTGIGRRLDDKREPGINTPCLLLASTGQLLAEQRVEWSNNR
jgi:hypothetical protein